MAMTATAAAAARAGPAAATQQQQQQSGDRAGHRIRVGENSSRIGARRPALMACVLLVSLLASFQHNGVLVQARRTPQMNPATLQRRHEEARLARLHADHSDCPQRDRRQICDAQGNCYYQGVQASLMEGMGMVFCKDCPNPHLQGSHMDTWEAAVRPEDYHVDGEVVFGVPNDASTDILNEVGGAIVLVNRGEVPFVDKVMRVQKAGGIAAVIVDDGSCGENFQCGGWIGSKADGYLARRDAADAWRNVIIPSVFVTYNQAQRLIGLMETVEMDMPPFGTQIYVP